MAAAYSERPCATLDDVVDGVVLNEVMSSVYVGRAGTRAISDATTFF